MSNRKRVLYALASVFLLGAIRFYFLDYVEHHMLHDMAADVSAEYKKSHGTEEKSQFPAPPNSATPNASRNSSVTFYRSDDLATLITKSRALLKEDDSDEARKLVSFLEGISRGGGQSAQIILEPVGVDQSGALTSQTHPCEINGVQYANCSDAIYVEGDVQDISDSPGSGPIVTAKDGRCYALLSKDLATLRARRQQIDDLLQPLGKQFETKSAITGTQRTKACEPVILAMNKYQSEIDRARTQRETDEKALPAGAGAGDTPVSGINPQTSFEPRQIYRISDGVTAPTLISRVDPEYSEEGRAAKAHGEVMLSTVVDERGTAQDIKVVRGLGLGLDEKAIESVQRWKFRPGMKNGRPVAVRVSISINFRLL